MTFASVDRDEFLFSLQHGQEAVELQLFVVKYFINTLFRVMASGDARRCLSYLPSSSMDPAVQEIVINLPFNKKTLFSYDDVLTMCKSDKALVKSMSTISALLHAPPMVVLTRRPLLRLFSLSRPRSLARHLKR